MKHLAFFLKNSIKPTTAIFANFLTEAGLLLIHVYQVYLSGFFGGSCRYYPSCSEYAKQAFANRSPAAAFVLTVRRIFSCVPFGKFGYDPLPNSKDNKK